MFNARSPIPWGRRVRASDRALGRYTADLYYDNAEGCIEAELAREDKRNCWAITTDNNSFCGSSTEAITEGIPSARTFTVAVIRRDRTARGLDFSRCGFRG